MKFVNCLLLCCLSMNLTMGQETAPKSEPSAAAESASQTPAPEAATESEPPAASDADALQQAKDSATELVDDAKVKAEELAETVDQNATAQDVSTSLLHPIYVAAEAIAFPTFHWIAFALMAAGVVSYAFQLVLGKLVVLTKGSFSFREILSDTIGLLISAIGLILTTQAATENSGFPGSPSAVLSSAAAGVVLGLILYRWNQAEEIDAAHGRRHKKD